MLAVGVALRVVFQVWLASDPIWWLPYGNSEGFIRLTRLILAGDWFAGRQPFFYGPLYPYYLAGCFGLAGGEILWVPRMLQAGLGLGSVALVWRITRRVFDPSAALAAAALYAFYGPGLFFEAMLHDPTLSTFLLLVAIDLTVTATEVGSVRPRSVYRLLIAGVAFGLAAWGRGNVLVLLPVVMVLLLAAERRAGADWRATAQPALAFAIGAAAAIVPVTARNYFVAGDTVLLVSQGGINLFLGNNPEATGVFGLAPASGIVTDVDGQYFENTRHVAEVALGRPLRASEVSDYWTSRAFDWMRQEPADALRVTLHKIGLLVDPYEVPIHQSYEYYRSRFPLGFLLPGWGVLLPLALTGLVFVSWHRHLQPALLLLAAGYAASVVLFFVCDRYRFPLAPLLVPFAGSAIARFAEAVRSIVRGEAPVGRVRLVVAVAVFALCAVGVRLHPWRESLLPTWARAQYVALENLRHGQAWQRFGDSAAALDAYDEAVRLSPDYLPAKLGRASMLIQLNRAAEAKLILLKILDDLPEDKEARRLLATTER